MFIRNNNIKILFYLVSVMLFFMGCDVLTAPRKIVFFGDSLTAGYQIPLSQAYPAIIAKKVNPNQWQIVNAGLSGDTTTGGRERLGWVLKSKPDIVVVALGANDGLRGVNAFKIQKNLDAMVNQIQQSGATVVLVGMLLPTNYGEKYRTQFLNAYRIVAQRYVIGYVPFLLEGVAMQKDLNLSDGIHPNAKGHEIIAQKLFEILQPVMKKREAGQL